MIKDNMKKYSHILLLVFLVIAISGCSGNDPLGIMNKMKKSIEKHIITSDANFEDKSLLVPAKGFKMAPIKDFPVPLSVSDNKEYDLFLWKELPYRRMTSDLKNTSKRDMFSPENKLLSIKYLPMIFVVETEQGETMLLPKSEKPNTLGGIIFDTRENVFGFRENGNLAYWDLYSNETFWGYRIKEAHLYNIGYKNNIFVSINSRSLLCLNCWSGLPKWMLSFDGQVISGVINTDRYLWVLTSPFNNEGHKLYRINLDTLKISELAFKNIEDYFSFEVDQERLYLVTENSTKIVRINQVSGLVEKEYQAKIGNTIGSFLDRKTGFPFEFKAGGSYYLLCLYKNDSIVKLENKLNVVDETFPLNQREYWQEDKDNIFAISPITGDKKWQISKKENNLGEGARVVLSVSDLVFVADDKYLYGFE
ncbi:MAG: hypothetical protein KBC24_05195 [Caldisericia bacterium]|nr:hypothetical protein [Caldisericia bacterium]